MSEVTLRVVPTDGWHDWRGVRLAALAESPSAFGSRLADWQGPGDREERWRGRLSIPGAHDLIAELDGEAVGMASGVPDGPRAGEVISMWVAPGARGRGVGDALLRGIGGWAREVGLTRLHLAVRVHNAAARGLYVRHGFEVTGEVVDETGEREQLMVLLLPAGPG